MYTIEVFLAILAIDGILTLYAVVAKGSDYYKDIAAIIFAGFLSCYLALVCVSGTVVYYNDNVSDVFVTNTNMTYPPGEAVRYDLEYNNSRYAYTYAAPNRVMQDDGLMWIFIIIAVIQGYFALLMGIEAYNDYVAGKADRENLI